MLLVCCADEKMMQAEHVSKKFKAAPLAVYTLPKVLRQTMLAFLNVESACCLRATCKALSNDTALWSSLVLHKNYEKLAALCVTAHVTQIKMRCCDRYLSAAIVWAKQFPLQKLDLRGLHVTSICWRRVETMDTLVELDLKRSRGTQNDYLNFGKALSKLKSLRVVNLESCLWVRESTLKKLAQLPDLEHLDLSGCSQLTTASLDKLRVAPKLKRLLLPEKVTLFGPTPPTLEHLTVGTWFNLQHSYHLTHLKELNIKNCDLLSDQDYLCMDQFTKLEALRLVRCIGIKDTDLQVLGRLKSLKVLHLAWCKKVTDAGMVHLATLPHLEHVVIVNCKGLTDTGLGCLATLNLTVLSLFGCDNVTDAGIKSLTSLKLQSLGINACNKLTDKSLEHISTITSLKSVMAQKLPYMTRKGIEYLARLPRLKNLELRGSFCLTDVGLALLAHVPHLIKLDLRDCFRITDVGLVFLLAAQKLRIVNLAGCDKITVVGVRHLLSLPELGILDVEGCKQITENFTSKRTTVLKKLLLN